MIKKYKLIKKYPCSPELGTIVSRENEFNNYAKYIDDYPEFWEEVIKKEYEILSLSCETGAISTYEIMKQSYNNKEMYLSYYLRAGWWIHSIKRLSDGVIFTVGEEVKPSDLIPMTIKKFEIADNELIILLDTKFECIRHLDHIEKIPVKSKLFTTDDGVDVFGGDEIYYINTNNLSSSMVIDKMKVGETYDRRIKDYLKYFKNKENAEKYIIENKPCLSYNEAIDVFCEKYDFKWIEQRGDLYMYIANKLGIK